MIGAEAGGGTGQRQGRNRLAMLLAAVSTVLLAVPSMGSAATVTGTITDAATGQPIAGAEVIADYNNSPVQTVITDGVGNYEIQLNPAKYSLLASADGYFTQEIGAQPGNVEDKEMEIGPLGRSGLDSALISDAAPFFWLSPPTMKWSPETRGGFRSMVLELSYGGSFDLPEGWPEDGMVVRLVDASGRSVWPDSTGGDSWLFGSADGCSFLNSVKHPPNIEQLRVIGYLNSNPGNSKEVPVIPDMTGCNLSRLEVQKPAQVGAHKVLVDARLADRLPPESPVPGTVSMAFNHKKPIRRHTADIAEEGYAATVATRALHYGRNTLKISFIPAIASVRAPPDRTIRFKLSPPPHRHR